MMTAFVGFQCVWWWSDEAIGWLWYNWWDECVIWNGDPDQSACNG